MADTIGRAKTAADTQQEFANLFGYQDTIIWDLYKSEERNFLKQRIEQIIPDVIVNVEQIAQEKELTVKEKENKIMELITNARKENKKISEVRKTLLEMTWAQRKYNNGNLLMSIVYVIITELNETNAKCLQNAKNSTTFSVYPLLRVLKCRMKKTNKTENCCMIFVDDNGRVYKMWQDYVENNNLPEGIIVAPLAGVYDFDGKGNVKLECFLSPASKPSSKALNIIDKGAGVLGLGAAMVPVATLMLPVAAPVLAGAAIVGGLGGLWSVGRSTGNLIDRGQHEESISVADRQARSSWLGVVGGALSFGAAGASRAVVELAGRGRVISNTVQWTVNGLNIAALVTNGLGVGNGVIDIILRYQDEEEISSLEFLQLASSLALFTHSVYNFQYASTVIESTQNGKIKEFRSELSKRQRKSFDKILRETIRIKGETIGKTDVIRAIKNIPDNKIFNDMYKVNKELNKHNVRASLGPDGKIILNDSVSAESHVLRESFQQNAAPKVLENVGPLPSTSAGSPNSSTISDLSNYLGSKVLTPRFIANSLEFILMNFTVLDKDDLHKNLDRIKEKFSKDICEKIMEIVTNFALEKLSTIQRKLERFVPFEELLSKAFEIFSELADIRSLTLSFIDEKIHDIYDLLRKSFEDMNNQSGSTETCKYCGGFYTIATLK